MINLKTHLEGEYWEKLFKLDYSVCTIYYLTGKST